jgi:tellurite resistance protein
MDAHEAGGLWLLREMWDFPSGVPEDDRVDYLKVIMACAQGSGELAQAEKDWVIGYGAACGAHQSTVDALEAYEGGEDVVEILERNMPVAETWGRVAVFDAIRASGADGALNDDERDQIRRVADRLGVRAETLAAIEALCDDEQALKRRRIDLVFGSDIPYQGEA